MKEKLKKLIEIYKDRAENEYSSDARQQAIFYAVISDLEALPLGTKIGVELITEERTRQIEEEGWTPSHDDNHDNGELAAAAGCYALWTWSQTDAIRLFPFDEEWLKASDEDIVRNLIKAGALIAAEIDRLNRLK